MKIFLAFREIIRVAAIVFFFTVSIGALFSDEYLLSMNCALITIAMMLTYIMDIYEMMRKMGKEK
jgi:hypothetical protein